MVNNYVYANVYMTTLKSIIIDFENQIMDYELEVTKLNDNERFRLAMLRKECVAAKSMYKAKYKND